MNLHKLIIILLITSGIFSPADICAQVYNNNTGAVKLLPPEKGMYAGVFPHLGGTEDSVSKEKIDSYLKLTGHKPVWIYFSNVWLGKIYFPYDKAETISNEGIIPFIRVMPRIGFTTGKKDDFYSLEKIISGYFDKDLRQWASDAKRFGKPLIAEFGPEMNGNWFPWSGVFNGGGKTDGYGTDEADGPEKYKDAFRKIVTVCREEGALNITWVYHVNAIPDPAADWNTMKSYYPGDDYIDWIGVSVYGSQVPGWDWTEFADVFENAYSEMCRISDTKPLSIIEFGVTEDPKNGNKAKWIEKAFKEIMSGRYPRLKAVCYWHSAWMNEDSSISNLRVDSSPEALNMYRKYINDDFFAVKPVFREEQ